METAVFAAFGCLSFYLCKSIQNKWQLKKSKENVLYVGLPGIRIPNKKQTLKIE